METGRNVMRAGLEERVRFPEFTERVAASDLGVGSAEGLGEVLRPAAALLGKVAQGGTRTARVGSGAVLGLVKCWLAQGGGGPRAGVEGGNVLRPPPSLSGSWPSLRPAQIPLTPPLNVLPLVPLRQLFPCAHRDVALHRQVCPHLMME